jgi:WS/DGAT/MGAT family acyltransferase
LPVGRCGLPGRAEYREDSQVGRRLNRVEALSQGFLLAERPETPMHVAGLHLLTMPRGVRTHEFMTQLADNLRSTDRFQPPFGERLHFGPLGQYGPLHWEQDDAIDLDYHIRHSALPEPGRYRELFALVSRLHSTLLDRNRPLWEMHLIEGLKNRQFAYYSKYHHAAIDGIKGIHLAQSMYSTDPNETFHHSPLSVEAGERYRRAIERLHRRAEPLDGDEAWNVAEALKAQLDTAVHLASAVRRYAAGMVGMNPNLAVPWRGVPQSAINTKVYSARRFVAQSWPFARIRAVGKAMDSTFNDAVLAMCAGALRRYLKQHAELPRESLKAMVPVSLRQAGDLDSSNAVGAITADLGTNIRDPLKRVRCIRDSMLAGKSLFAGMSAREAAVFTQLLQVPGLLMIPLGLATRFPAFSTIISNVPGPRQTLYWNGARLDGMYPASIVVDGVALNITLVTYDRNVDFGITACRRTLPQIQRFIDYLEESLVELEQALGLAQAPGRRTRATAKKKTARRRKATPRKTAARGA